MTSTEILIFVVIGYVGNEEYRGLVEQRNPLLLNVEKDQKGDGFLNEDGGYTSRVYRRTRCRCGAGVDIQILLH